MNDWIDSLDKEQLIALIPVDALPALDSPEFAARSIGQDIERKKAVGKSYRRSESAASAPKEKRYVRRETITPYDGRTVKADPKRPARYNNIYEGIKAEIALLICTDDKKYAPLRKALAKHESKMTMATVGVIAASVSSVLGLAAGVCIPFVAYILLVTLSVGKNAFCGTLPLPQPKKTTSRRKR